MMYKELALIERNIDEVFVQESVFEGLRYGLTGFVIPSFFLHEIKQVLPGTVTLSCPIDFPYGISDTKTRTLAALEAHKRGANAIDLVAQFHYLNHQFANKFIEDVTSIKRACDDYGIAMRLIFEYRLYEHIDLLSICKILPDLGLHSLVPSTGTFVDSFSDHLIVCKDLLDNTNMTGIIFNANVMNKQQYDLVKSVKPFGIRFHSVEAAKRCILM